MLTYSILPAYALDESIMKQTPKQLGYTMPGEWYPHKGCWMAWPCHVATWSKIGLERAGLAYARTALAIAQYEPVTLIVRPEDKELAYTLCQDKVRYFTLAINDSWLRDTGPSFLIHKDKPLAGVDWIHNAWGNNYKDFSQDQRIASSILKHSGAQIFSPPLVMEGGAFHVDGQGTILTTKECLLHANRNPQLSQLEIERYLCDYLGAKKVIWLNRGLVGDETNGHVDEVACFIGPGKMLCLITQDKEDPNYFILQENLAILKAARDTQGRPFEVFTVEQPPATFLEGERLTLSYINFYHANKGIIMPSFGYHSYDKAAHDLFIRLLPGYGISQIHALDIFAGGGGIHCITQQEPQIQALA